MFRLRARSSMAGGGGEPDCGIVFVTVFDNRSRVGNEKGQMDGLRPSIGFDLG